MYIVLHIVSLDLTTTTNHMTILFGGSRFSLLKHLLLFSLVACIDDSEETDPQQVEGKKGDSVTLKCASTKEVLEIHIQTQTKTIKFTSEEQCDSRICQTVWCDITLKDLRFSDARKYTLKVYPKTQEPEIEPVDFIYRLHIRDDISLNTGDNLTLDVVLPEAVEVRHLKHTEHELLWRKGDEPNKRVTVSDGNLTISNITESDAGTYNVLDQNNKTLITVTVEVKASEHQNYKANDQDTGSRERRYLAISLFLIVLLVLFFFFFAVIVELKALKSR